MFEFIKKLLAAYMADKDADKNRRRNPRIVDHFTLKFRCDNSPKWHDATGRDISEEGARFAAQKKPKKGEIIDVILFFPNKFEGSKSLELKAKTVRLYRSGQMKRSRVGIEFIFEDEKSRSIIRDFSEWLLTNPYDIPYKPRMA